MTQDEMKIEVAKAALKYVIPDSIIGVGQGQQQIFSSMNWRQLKNVSMVQWPAQ